MTRCREDAWGEIAIEIADLYVPIDDPLPMLDYRGGMNDRLEALAQEKQAFDAMQADLRRRHGTGFAVVHAGELFQVYATRDEAFDAAVRNFGTTTPFLVERIERREEAEAPALVLGLVDAKAP